MSGARVIKPDEASKRASTGEVVGGGWWVFKRMTDGRISPGPRPFEHPSQMAADNEARRLARLKPGHVFIVAGQIGDAISVAPEAVGHD